MRILPPLLRRNQSYYERWSIMPRRDPYLLLRPKVLFTLATVILAACAIHRPWRLLLIFSGKGLTRVVVLVVAGLLIAALVHELGRVCLRTKGSPWYTRRAAPIFLLAALIGINALLPTVDRIAFAAVGTGPFLSSAAAANALIGIELIWFAVLE